MEDNDLVVGALRILLEATGHRVSAAGTVAAAVAACRATLPDVMLLDLTLPDGDGLLVLEALGEGGTGEGRPAVTIAMTGRDDEATVARCLEAGCREVLTKPVPTRLLIARIAEWVAPAGGGPATDASESTPA
ncbi:MAG: response regulator transcription factor [Gemmatimonadaceae bacterium]